MTMQRRGFGGPLGASGRDAPGSGPARLEDSPRKAVASLAMLRRQGRLRIGRPTSAAPLRRIVVMLLLICSSASQAFRFTAQDDVTAGSKGYWSNTLGIGLDPSDRISFGITAGAGNTGSPYEDRTKSGGLTFWSDLGKGVSAALDGNYYSGSRADILDFQTFDVVGRADDRQTTGSFGATVAWRFLDSGGEETADDLVYSARVEAGAGGNKTTVPVWARAPVLLKGDGRLGDYVFRDRTYSAGLSMIVEGSTAGVRYLRHHYRRPDDLTNLNPRVARAMNADPRLSAFLRDRVEEFMRTSVGGTIEGVPKYQTSVWLSERVHEKITIHGSLDYIRLESNGIARTYGASLGWMVSERFDLRAGSLWDRQNGATFRATTLGATISF